VKVSIGCVPIVWNNVDDPDLAPLVPYATILDELARLGFSGTQFGRGFPEGDALAAELERRGLRLAEWYCPLPASADGLTHEAVPLARATLARLVASGGEVLVVALDGSPERDPFSGRVTTGAPRWPDPAFEGLAGLLDELAGLAPGGVRVAFHPHTATWVEAPDEVDALADRLRGSAAGLCMDVGHYLVGGGDPVEAIRRHGPLIRHVHAKDVDPAVLARLASGELDGFMGAIRARLFTELGRGSLDLPGVVRALREIHYAGWLMVEQDSSWLPPAEAAEIGAIAVREALRELDR
jgi:inosose dehydratase